MKFQNTNFNKLFYIKSGRSFSTTGILCSSANNNNNNPVDLFDTSTPSAPVDPILERAVNPPTAEQLNRAVVKYNKNNNNNNNLPDLNKDKDYLSEEMSSEFNEFIKDFPNYSNAEKHLTLEEFIGIVTKAFDQQDLKDSKFPKLGMLLEYYKHENPTPEKLQEFVTSCLKDSDNDAANIDKDHIEQDTVEKDIDINSIEKDSKDSLVEVFKEWGNTPITTTPFKLFEHIKFLDVSVNAASIISVPLTYRLLLNTFKDKYVNAKIPTTFNRKVAKQIRLQRSKHFGIFAVFIAPVMCIGNALLINKTLTLTLNVNGQEIASNSRKSLLLFSTNKILKKIKSNSLISFSLFIFLLVLTVYLLGVNTTINYITSFFLLIKEYRFYLYILILIPIVILIAYLIWSLYVLHIYCKKTEQGEKIYIPKTLPDFLIKELELLKSFSKEQSAVKIYKKDLYTQLSIYFIVTLYLIFVFTILA